MDHLRARGVLVVFESRPPPEPPCTNGDGKLGETVENELLAMGADQMIEGWRASVMR